MTRVALLGCGSMGTTHAHAYKSMKNVRVVAVCDIRKEQREFVASLLDCPACASYEEMKQHYEWDMLDVCLPTYLHPEYALDAMQEKKHVFCEKPIALTVSDAQRMIDTAKEHGVLFTVGHVLRFFPPYQQAVKEIERGRVGIPRLIRTLRNQPFPPWSWELWYQDTSKSGGPEIDLAIHDYDFIAHHFGTVDRVYAKSFGTERKDQMHSLAILRLKNGSMAHVEASWAMPQGSGLRMGFEVVGTEGQLCWDSHKDTPLKTILDIEESDPLTLQNPMMGKMDPYATQLRAFIQAIEKGTEIPVKPEEALAALKIGLAAIKSAQTGTAVRLEEVK